MAPKFNAHSNNEFTKELISSTPLDTAVEWIRDHMHPEDIFDEDELADWAKENGYVKEA
jgi:hypothetical protein